MARTKKESEEVVEEVKTTSKKAKQKEEVKVEKPKKEQEKSKIEEDTNKKVQDIVAKAKEKGEITYGELATQLGEINPEQIDKVFDAFEEMGVDVLKDDLEEEPDIEDLEELILTILLECI